MATNFFLQGLAIGFAIAAPVGPIGVLCIRRALAHGMLTGFVVGLGAATADAAYGAVAGFGLTAISGILVGQQLWLGLIGGVFMLYLGVHTFRSRASSNAGNPSGGSLLSTYVSTLFLTLTNPATIISFGMLFAAFGLGQSPEYQAACALVSGVFLGSAAWWLILSGSVGLLRARVTARSMEWINRISGAVLVGFGIYAIFKQA